MKRLLWPLIAAAVAGCDPYAPPVIERFSVDNANPVIGTDIHLIFEVHDASIISIIPEPGEVVDSPVTVKAHGPTTYTLRAGNNAGWSSKDVTINAHVLAGAKVQKFQVLPSQGSPGIARTITWDVKDSVTLQLTGPGLDSKVAPSGSIEVKPATTTTYTLTGTSTEGFAPITARTVARVLSPAVITSFQATPGAILQGEASLLTWAGTAPIWEMTINGMTRNLGMAQSLLVRPAATTTYRLLGIAATGTAGPQDVTVQVTPRAGTTLQYTDPPAGSEKLRLVADACAAPCTSLTLRLRAAAAVSLRGVAINLPVDSTKATIDPASSAEPNVAGKAVIGKGPLKDTLVLGAALQSSAGTPAADRALAAGAELSHFVLALQSAGGQGVVFDGSTAFQSWIQNASGRAPGGIAVGRLEAK